MTQPQHPLADFLRKIPVLSAYREKEMRREVDRRLREALAQALEAQRRRVTDLQRDLLRVPGGLGWMGLMERVQSRFTLLMDKIRTATDGYRPLFDLERVDEAALERLRRFDQDFAQEALRVEEDLDALRQAVGAGDAPGLETGLRRLLDRLDALLRLWEQRDRLLQHPDARWSQG